MNYRQVGLLSAGHLVTDINQGALPAMLPFFVAAYDLSYAAAAGIVFAANMTSSLVQPIFGHAADRFSKPWLLPAGLLTAGIGLALTGLFRDYAWIVSMAVLSGIGIAAYHPEAARLVHYAAGSKKGTAMSLFGVGGTVGFAVGPPIATAAILQWGLNGTLVLIFPVTLMALVMANRFSLFASTGAIANGGISVSENGGVNDNWSAFLRLTLTIIARSILFYGLNTFIPLYWINGLSQSKTAGAMALTLFAGSGIVGNLAGGRFADRFGQKKAMIICYLGLALFLPWLILTNSAQMALLLMLPIGLMLHGTYSPSIVLGQRFLPNRIGFSSGITLGVAVAIGGGAAPFIGKIADSYGIWYSLASISFIPIVILSVALSLPGRQGLDGAISR